MTDDSNYFDHDADIGIIGRGSSLEAAFVDAAKTMFSVMTDLSGVLAKIEIVFSFEEEDNELAFITWLNLLLAKADSNHLVFSHFEIIKKQNNWLCRAYGEPWRNDMHRGIEVKGATLTMLSVKQSNHQWEVQCVVDV